MSELEHYNFDELKRNLKTLSERYETLRGRL